MNIDNFTGRAEAYAKGRPGYTKEAVDKIVELAPQGAVFADIGAGTGKLTKKLADSGCIVYAVEPNNDMRGEMLKDLKTYKNVTIFDGTAENTKIPDNSVDVITVAHALHWFDIEAFKRECKRILKQDGLVIIVYNHVPGRENIDFCRQAIDKLFKKPKIWSFNNPISYTKENWIAYIQSHDDSILPGEVGYDEYIKLLSEKFDEQSVDGLIRCDRIIRVYCE